LESIGPTPRYDQLIEHAGETIDDQGSRGDSENGRYREWAASKFVPSVLP